MKSVTLNLRISQKLRDRLIDDSHEKGITLSDNSREILTAYCKAKNSDEIDNQTLYDIRFYNSSEFIYLIFWMFEKIRSPKHFGPKTELEDLKKIVLQVVTNKFFPPDLKQEFEKVLIDIQRVTNEFDSENNQFKFSQLCTEEVFDYSILTDFIRNKAFENRIYL
ncbi:hypothetical protein [Flavobacterium degerlachei]|jgi:hypothetical protein|uniref:Uncharacterized protein n=1 Tax=Flavobacterium degerlachei TaxID=229203 RepID=A0A1H3CG13_9FLAO|nr:hypothetical protein [Flavobacterium degerlachei]SDX53087.1 hypothetical protein SAMN05444338_111107 [Flavobacterium degerlachei]